jgi:hypothetical protein
MQQELHCLSLNSASEPHYLGLSSGFSWARTILGILKPPSTSLFTPEDSRYRPSHPSNRPESPKLPSEAVSDALIEAFYMHVQARHPFMYWRQLKSWVAKRELLVGRKSSYEIGTPGARLIGTASFFVSGMSKVGLSSSLAGWPMPLVRDWSQARRCEESKSQTLIMLPRWSILT